MKLFFYGFTLYILCLAAPLFPQEPLITEIAGSIETYKGREITLVLRLSYVDRVFQKIVFYDRKNNSVEFDISPEAMKKLNAGDFMNLHEGLEYRVVMLVRDRGAGGGLVADLKSFRPSLVEKLP